MIEDSKVRPGASESTHREVRLWPIYVALAMTIAGLILFAIGSLMPAYTDPIAAEKVRRGEECERGIPNTNDNWQCDDALWHRTMGSLRTNKWDFIDGGGGLLASGMITGIFSWRVRKKSWRQLQTPKSKMSMLALISLAWLAQIPAYEFLMITDLTRGHLPHWADSIAIPMMQIPGLFLALFLPYIAIWLLFLVGARLPVEVFSTLPGRPGLNVFWAVAAGLISATIALVLVGAVLEGPTVMVPFLWMTLWFTLCARAAALSRHRSGNEAGIVAGVTR